MKYVAVLFLLLMVAVAVAQQAPIVKIVNNFSEGMTPGAGFWTNNPERIIVSENMMVTAIGNRTKRFGLRKETSHVPILSGITALIEYIPQFDSTALLYTAGGRWFYQKTGIFDRKADPGGSSYWSVTPGNDTTLEILPWNGGTSISLYNGEDTVIGIGTRWIRDLQAGDSITAANETRAILNVISDTRIQLTADFAQGADSTGVTVWSFQRTHSTSGIRPWMHQYGDDVFTGTLANPPQVIYATDTNMYIKPLGIVDSMTVDKLYNVFIDSILGSSWDSTTGGDLDTQIFFIQVVDRNKSWEPMEWAKGINGQSMTYYFHWGLDGAADDTAFWQHTFEIISNSDTSLLLKASYVNTFLNDGGTYQGLGGRARLLQDTLTNAEVSGSTGYIFCATGIVTEVFSEEQCGEAIIHAAGAVWSTTSLGGSPALVDTVNQHQFQYGNFYIEILEEITVPITRKPAWDAPLITVLRRVSDGPPPVDTDNGESIAYGTAGDTTICTRIEGPSIGGGKTFDFNQCIKWRRWWINPGNVIRNVSLLGKLFHIDMSYWEDDSLHLVTSNMEFVDLLAGDLPVKTITKWRIVKAGMPQWSGMTEFNRQLMAWGDTSAVGMINFSYPLEPFKWTPVGPLGEAYDVFLSGNPSDPVVSVYPFDDKAFVFRRQSMLAYNGVSFTEISSTDGLASPSAVVGEGKFLYWLDVDGVKRIQRRDFSGYSITKISMELDPIFNGWVPGAFGYQMVPYGMSAENRDKAVLSYNRRDRHLYLFFNNFVDHVPVPTSDLGTKNNKALTYNIDLKIWDGVQTIPASAAIWATQLDTAKIFIGSPDSAFISSIDYSTFADYGTEETMTILRSAGFHTADQWGMPIKSKLEKVMLLLRTLGTDSLHVTFRPLDIDARDLTVDTSYFIRDPRNDILVEPMYQWKPMGNASHVLKDGVMYTVYPDSSNIGSHWNWEIRHWSNDGISIFQLMKMWMKFVPVEDY